jgi:Arc/MetJ-type ribon-helix-helix transcriptional regulator
MNVSLRPSIQKFIDEQVKSGRFATPQDVLEAGVARSMLEPDPDVLDAEDVAAIEESEQQIERGESLAWKYVSPRLRSQNFRRASQ